MSMFRRIGVVRAFVLATVIVTGCSSGKNGQVATGKLLAHETAIEVQLLDQQSGDAYNCAEQGGTFQTCLAWEGAIKRALDRGQTLRLRGADGSLTKQCAEKALALSKFLTDWHDAAIQWKTTAQLAALPPRTSISDMYIASDGLSAACAR
jgi:hypothetical protein